MKQQSRAVQARWAAEEATEQALSEHFRSIPVEKGLTLLAQMRSNCTIAGTILNERINEPKMEKCKTCHISWDDYQRRPGTHGKDWVLRRPHYHPEDRHIIVVDVFCSMACVARENQVSQGVRGVADRGMIPSDNPRNHPRQVNVDELHKNAI